jgi:enediyne biosynthesis protein E4
MPGISARHYFVLRSRRRFFSQKLLATIWLVVCLPTSAPAQSRIELRDVTAETGIAFVHTDGSGGQRYIVEYVSTGLVLFDYDGDGYEDIYFLNGAPLKGTEWTGDPPRNALYRNNGDWTFTDVTEKAGVGDTGFALGATAADYNNNGYLDLYVNNFGANVLYRNNGDGTFTDVTQEAGVSCGEKVGAGVCFLDINANGNLDLYVASYVKFSYDNHVPHVFMGVPSYASPMDYQPESDNLFRNNGDGTFTDVSQESGIGQFATTSMGMVCSDFNNDGHIDIFVGNDVMPNSLLLNDGDGSFTEAGMLHGVAFDVDGGVHGSMGTDLGDYDNDGLLDLFVTSYGGELSTLYRNLGNGFFEDVTRKTGAGASTFPHVTWGHGLIDFDNDGYRDLFIACGDLDDNVELRKDTTAYALPNILMRNTGNGRFVDVSSESGDGMQVRRSSRGVVFGDLDNDGRLDVVVLNSRAEPTVLRNKSPGSNHWLQIHLRGKTANRYGVGARVKVTAGDLIQVDEVHSGRSYQSHFGLRLHFGLGMRDQIDHVEVRWPGGRTEVFEQVEINRITTLVEGTGN